jgi:hypothetical protein
MSFSRAHPEAKASLASRLRGNDDSREFRL